ncbi:MAG: hypothetical protein JXR60_00055 [Bacteroidales bacterium]|nr:hypothetical protein [Bacteroidales bacterium]
MELNDIKKTWAAYNETISDNIKLNEQLMRKMNMNSSKNEMQKILIYEVVGLIFSMFLIIMGFTYAFKFLNELRFSLPGFVAAITTVAYLIFGLIRTKAILNIDYFSAPVVAVQRAILELKKKTLFYRKFEIMLLPILISAIIPLLFKVVRDVDIYLEPKTLIIETAIFIGIALPATLWVNKYLYDKKFKNVESLLAELDQFEKE